MKLMRNRKSFVLTVALAWLAVMASSPGAQEDGWTPWQVATLEGVSAAEISPDGRYVAYVLSVPRAPGGDDGASLSELHVMDYGTGVSRPFVTAKTGAGRPRWMPDGESIAFLAKRGDDEHTALYILPVGGGEARRAAGFDDRGISTYDLSPDGKQVAVIARAPKSDDREAEEKQGFKAEIYEEDWRPGEVWVLTLFAEDEEPAAVPVAGHASALQWSPDGSRLAVAVAPTALVDDSYMKKRVWIVDAQTGDVAAQIGTRGKLGSFSWKPDGSGLALIAAIDEHDGAAARLHWAPAQGMGDIITPTPLLGERERDEAHADWLADGRLVVRGSQGVWSNLDAYRVEDAVAVGRDPLLPLEGPVWTSATFSQDGRRAALVGSTPEHPSELYTLDLETRELKRRTDSNPWLGELAFARQEVIRYEARDGLVIEGILIHPLGGEAPAPLIVNVHGGPEAHLSNGWLTRYAYAGQVGAANGYAIFYPNYRGSTGRGLAFLKHSQGDPAGKEFDDVVDGVDHLIEIGVADRDRVGVTGGSYGGYATAWFSTYYSDRFAAGVMFVGISNKISKVGTTDIADEEFYVHALKRPWDDWQFFMERSPIYYADRGKTPLLILHGKEDTRVDPGQSREMYRHLKLRGQAPVRLVHYPGEGHGNRKAGARFDYSLRMLRWFDHYLKGEGGDPPTYEVDYESSMPADDKQDEEQPVGS